MYRPFHLSARHRSVLETLVARVAGAEAGAPRVRDAADTAADRIGQLEPRRRRQLLAAMRLLDSRASVAACIGRARRFTTLPPIQQERVLRSWELSRLPLRRTIFQALRRLTLAAWYSQPSSLEEIGWPGALHSRPLRFPWEGPLPGADAHGPVLRANRSTPLPDPALSPAGLPRGVLSSGEYADGDVLRADACIIGSGAGGAVAAARLAEAGLDVVVVEEGSWIAANELTESEAELLPRLYAEAATRSTDDLAVSILQGRCAGGSSTVNWLVMLRASDDVLGEWSDEFGAERFKPAAMAQAYDIIERETSTSTVPDDAHSPNNRVILEGARALGWRASSARINARGCVRAGSCGFGCRWGARQGALSVYLPRALGAGARIACDLRADRLEIAERGGTTPLKRLRCTALDPLTGLPRARVTVEAPLVVVAAGAIGTPALLLRSGLGSRAVGRHLRLHPTSAIVGVFDHAIHGGSGIPLSVVCDEFVRRDPHGHGFWIEAPPLTPVLAALALPGFGTGHAGMMRLYPRLSGTIVLVRDGAARTPGGRVRVRPDGSTRIDYELSVPDRRHLLDGMAAAARLVLAAGAREAHTLHAPPFIVRNRADAAHIPELPSAANQLSVFSAHVMGTCRVGKQPALGACAADGELFGVPGCYVADGSLMPTAPGVNPQETIMALASIVSDDILAKHGVSRSSATAQAAG